MFVRSAQTRIKASCIRKTVQQLFNYHNSFSMKADQAEQLLMCFFIPLIFTTGTDQGIGDVRDTSE